MGYYNNRRYKKTYKRSYKKNLSTAQRALSVALKNKQMMNVEYKHKNVQLLNTAVTDAGTIQSVCLLTEGITSQTRTGGQIKWTSFRWAYSWVQNASATTSLVRCMVVHDK